MTKHIASYSSPVDWLGIFSGRKISTLSSLVDASHHTAKISILRIGCTPVVTRMQKPQSHRLEISTQWVKSMLHIVCNRFFACVMTSYQRLRFSSLFSREPSPSLLPLESLYEDISLISGHVYYTLSGRWAAHCERFIPQMWQGSELHWGNLQWSPVQSTTVTQLNSREGITQHLASCKIY